MRLLVFAPMLVIVAGCGKGYVMSNDVRSLVTSATNVEAFRVGITDGHGKDLNANGRAVIAYNCVVLTKPAEQSKDWLRSMQVALEAIDKDSALNRRDNAKDCAPQPGVAVRFTSPSGKLDMLICYECQMLAFAEVGSKKVLGWWNFDSQNSEFIRLAKEAFPNDKDIQTLEKQ